MARSRTRRGTVTERRARALTRYNDAPRCYICGRALDRDLPSTDLASVVPFHDGRVVEGVRVMRPCAGVPPASGLSAEW